MIMIFGALVLNDVSPGFVFYYYFDIFIFQSVRWVKEQKMAQNEK